MSNVNNKICLYIVKEWLTPWLEEGKSQTSFANAHNVEESTIRKIKGNNNYRVPVETLYRICEARKVTLFEFFKEVGI